MTEVANKKVGRVFSSYLHGDFTVVKYISEGDVSINFHNTGNTVNNLKWKQILGCKIKDYMSASLCGVGYIGLGSFDSKSQHLGRNIYKTWAAMLGRCHSDKRQKAHPTYVGCSVAKEWHNFQNFAKWFVKNYRVDCELDKDLLVKGNKVYSPATCIYISKEVNSVLTNKKVSQDNSGTVGISFKNSDGKYVPYIRDGKGKNIKLGCFTTIKEAEFAYMQARLERLIDLANKQEVIQVKMALFERSMVEIKETLNKY